MREISMKLGFRWWVMVAVAFAGALFPPATSLARRMGGGAPRPIRIEGYWDRHRTDPGILEDVTISAPGHAKRDFGIAALQAYKPEEEGPQVLRHSSLEPVTLLLTGRKEMVEQFMTARPDQKITALGLYRAGPGQLVLSSVEIADGTAPPGAH